MSTNQKGPTKFKGLLRTGYKNPKSNEVIQPHCQFLTPIVSWIFCFPCPLLLILLLVKFKPLIFKFPIPSLQNTFIFRQYQQFPPVPFHPWMTQSRKRAKSWTPSTSSHQKEADRSMSTSYSLKEFRVLGS
jgi:hypothetical protein